MAGFLTHHCERPVAVLHGMGASGGQRRPRFEVQPPPRSPMPAAAPPDEAMANVVYMGAGGAAAGIATATGTGTASAPATAAATEAATATAGTTAATTAATTTATATASTEAASGRNLLVPVEGSDESLLSCRWTLDHLYRPGKE